MTTRNSSSHPWDVVVIGGGVAGLSAAQALGRSLRRTLVIDAGSPRNRFASHMHNVLGLDGTPPLELLARGRDEAAAYGVEFRDAAVRSVRDGLSAGGDAGAGEATRTVVVELENGERIEARALIAATGVRDALPEIPGLADNWGSGVLHCPYCHGWEVRGRRIAVLTTSPLGMHQARLLRQWSDDVTVFTAGLGDLDPGALREFEARGVRLDPSPVARVVGDGARITSVRTADGGEHPVDAVFTAGALVPYDDYLAPLALERSETPMGEFVAVDPTGRTSHPRVWGAGNIVNPAATVPVAMAAGLMAGAMVNAVLVDEDFADAAAEAASHAGRTGPVVDPDEAPVVFWQRKYGESERVWSGRVNETLAALAADWAPGRSLDLGCGEGGDVLWLAERGWSATGIDLSEIAVSRAAAAAAERGLEAASFLSADLTEWAAEPARFEAGGPFDLVTASFFQSPVALDRQRILRAAAASVAPGGRIALVSHGAPPQAATPPGSQPAPAHHGPGDFPSPEAELQTLGLAEGEWEVELAAIRPRTHATSAGTGPHAPQHLEETVVVARRLA